jgi:HEAT repeat protein
VRRLTSLVMDLPVSVIRKMPGQPEGVAGLALTALLVGLAAWGLTALTQLTLIGLATGAVGLLLAAVAVAALVSRKQKGLGLPVAAALVNLQAGVFAVLGGAFEPPPATGGGGEGGGARSPVAELRRAIKDQDQNARLKAAYQVGELARDLSSLVLELSTLLRDDRHTVRAAAAEALGQIGPPARMAYPALFEAAQGDAEEAVRRRAVDALKKIGPPTERDVIPFIEALKDKNTETRAAAAQGLRLIGPEARLAVPALAERMKEDPQVSVKVCAAQAIWALDRQQADGVLQELIAGLKALDPHVRTRAAGALAEMRADAQKAVPDLARALKDPESAEVRLKAAYALAAIGKAARSKVGALAAALKDENLKVRLYAAQALWAIDRQPTGVEVLTGALKNAVEDYRLTAVAGLLTIAEQSRPNPPAALVAAVPALTDALTSGDAKVRVFAARTLAALGEPAAGAVPALTDALKHMDPLLRAQAAFALVRIGPKARTALPALRDALNDGSAEVRLFAAQALGGLAEDAASVRRAVTKLTELLAEQKDGLLRAQAAFALGVLKAKTEAAIAALNEGLKDAGNAALRKAAAEALGKIGAPARITFPTLMEVADKDEDTKIRKAAADALKKVGRPTKEDVPQLKLGLKHKNARYRAAAVVALWMLQKEAQGATAALAECLDDPDETVRRMAPVALAGIGTAAVDAVPALARALGREDDEVLRARAAYALAEIGPKASAAAPALHKALLKGPASVRLNAAQALWAIEEKGADLVPVLCEILDGKENANLRASAAETLAGIGGSKKAAADEALGKALRDRGVPTLQKAAEDPDNTVRAKATVSLGAVGVFARPALPTLMQSLGDHVVDIRAGAAEALGKIGMAEAKANPKRVHAKVAYPKLMFLARLEEQETSREAMNLAMLRIGKPGANDVGALMEVLKDSALPLAFRTSAAQALSLIGPDVKVALKDMTEVLRKDAQAGVRALVAYALGDLGPDGIPAVPALAEALKADKDAAVRAAAAAALGEIGVYARPQVEPLLTPGLTDADETVQQATREALKKVRAAGK